MTVDAKQLCKFCAVIGLEKFHWPGRDRKRSRYEVNEIGVTEPSFFSFTQDSDSLDAGMCIGLKMVRWNAIC